MLNAKQQEYVDHAKKMFGKTTLTVAELKKANSKFVCKYAPQWLIKNKDYKVGKSLFKLPVEGDVVKNETPNKEAEKILTPVSETKKEAAYIVSSLTGNIVPKKDPIFVSFGNYPDIKSIVNYGQVVKLIRKLTNNKHYNFLETLAEDTFDVLFRDKRIGKITLKIEKLEILKDCSSVGIQITKKRSHDKF